jgi:hypothetical protein
MKVWPRRRRLAVGGLKRHRAHAYPSAELANWVLHDEKLLVETRFGGDCTLYAAWRDRLWAEMQDTMRHPDRDRRPTPDEEYVVRTAFDGDWNEYRVCRDRLREELWQIMKVTQSR